MGVGGESGARHGGRGRVLRGAPGPDQQGQPAEQTAAAAPTRPVTVDEAEDASVGLGARANCRSSTRVDLSESLACRVSARETALAMSAARSGREEVADTATIGASGEVSVRTLFFSVPTGTPAHTWASPSTATCVATRPYACAKPSADWGSDPSVGTATT